MNLFHAGEAQADLGKLEEATRFFAGGAEILAQLADADPDNLDR